MTGVLATSLFAGEYCAPCPDKCVVDECPEYSGSISGGYHSDYIWRGFQFAEENWTVDASYTLPFSDWFCLPDLTVGAWYLQSIPGIRGNGGGNEYEETNLYASIDLPTVFCIDSSLTYTNYRFQNDTDSHELALSASREIGGMTLGYLGAHDFTFETWYHEAGISRSLEINDCMSLELSSVIGYWDIQGSRGFAHRTTTLALPVQIGCQLTVTPYVGYIDTMRGGPTHRRGPGVGSHTHSIPAGTSPDDQFFGGVNAGWAF